MKAPRSPYDSPFPWPLKASEHLWFLEDDMVSLSPAFPFPLPFLVPTFLREVPVESQVGVTSRPLGFPGVAQGMDAPARLLGSPRVHSSCPPLFRLSGTQTPLWALASEVAWLRMELNGKPGCAEHLCIP
ncbi:hypothetical protein P7K49_005990 [Saguinus oedipus]|uniref:Uncharacterized protein n=1 Tax=Saguinus oedipus TaxID=9490 RepID=A0ABQ9W147_SAGOE|nr:hypothetical protein P7K49_005990 [Saguinus oedipus]